MAVDYAQRLQNAATLLSARIAAHVIEILDLSAPSYFEMYDSEGTALQTALEAEISRQVSRWMAETSDN